VENGLNFNGPTEDLDVFECPKCKETIDTSAEVCRFCGAKVDHEKAQKSAHLLATVDQACSDGSYLRNAALIAFCLPAGTVFGILRSGRIIVHVGFQNIVLGVCALVLVVSSPFPPWTLRWWTKYAGLPTDDEDFRGARRAVRGVGFAAITALALSAAIMCLILISKARSG
jgi:hypothetical protein